MIPANLKIGYISYLFFGFGRSRQRLFNLRFSERSGEKRQVETFVCARHGRELMGLKYPVCDPALSLVLNIKY